MSQCDNNSTLSILFVVSTGNISKGKSLDDNHCESESSNGFSGGCWPSSLYSLTRECPGVGLVVAYSSTSTIFMMDTIGDDFDISMLAGTLVG